MLNGDAILKTVGFDEVFCSTAEGWRVRAEMASVFRQNFIIPDNVIDFQILYKWEGWNRFVLKCEDGSIQRTHYAEVNDDFCRANNPNWESRILPVTIFIYCSANSLLVDFGNIANRPLHKLKFAGPT